MNSKKIILFVLVLIMLTVSVHGYFRNQYWECTGDGEASQGDAFGRRDGDICSVTCCILCVSAQPSIDCIGGGAQPQCTCNGAGGNGTIDTQAPEITFVSPTNGTTYNDNDIFLHVTTDEPVQYMKYAFDKSSLRGFCSSCSSATRTETRMSDGIHSVRIEAKDYAGNIATKKINFTVDTELPIIESLNPGNNAFLSATNEEFVVKYTESSLQSAKLFYKKSTSASYQQASFVNCESGESKSCSTTVNFGSFSQGDHVDVYVELKDVVNTVTSPVYTLTVDNGLAALPFLISNPGNNSIFNSRSVEFTIQSFIPNPEFEYSMDDGAHFKSLCKGTSCVIFTKKLSFADGNNSVIVRLLDESDNSYDQKVNFFIDSRKPSISSLEPRGGNEPLGGLPFVVEYTEAEHLANVSLHYGLPGALNTVVRFDCPTGKRVTCEFDIDLSPYNGQNIQYYAEVNDFANKAVYKTLSADVDTQAPVLTAGSLAFVQDKNVLLDLSVSEDVTLEYSDNGAKFTKLCSNCDVYNKQRSFNDGLHEVVVRATDAAENTDTHVYNFRVDSVAPKLNKFDVDDATNGTLLLSYNELNPVKTVLSYKPENSSVWTNATFINCPESAKGICPLKVNLLAYQGQNVEFTAYMTDIANRTVALKKSQFAIVDAIAPVLTVVSPSNGSSLGSPVLFTMSVSEPVDLKYSLDGGVRFSSLCSRCTSYDRTKSFRDGSYSVIFSAIDPAGNEAMITRTFSVF